MPTSRLLNSSKEQKVPAKDHGSVAALLETIELQGSKGSLFKRHRQSRSSSSLFPELLSSPTRHDQLTSLNE